MREKASVQTAIGFRTKFALDNLQNIRENLDKAQAQDLIQDWQIDMIHNILENERLTATTCRLSQKEFNWLKIISDNLKKAGL